MSFALEILPVLYGIMGVIYLVIAVRGILRKNDIYIFDLIRLMYAFVYGFVPCLIYFQEFQGERNLYFYDYSDEGIGRIVLMFVLSIIAYGLIHLSYKSVHKTDTFRLIQDGITSDQQEDISRRLLRSGIIALMIGWFCLVLWTRAYGSINNFILYASAIRSGRGTVYNRFAFVKQFVRIMPVSLYAIISAYCYERPRGTKKLFYLLLIAISMLGNYYYFMASDSRVTIIFIGMAVVMIFLRHRRHESVGRYLGIVMATILVLLLATMLADTFTYYARYGVWITSSEGLISSLTKEFRFICAAEMKVSKAWFAGDLHYKLADDFLNAITSWIPDRFIPFTVPDTVWTYNTNLYGAVGSGTAPSSLVATGIYELGLIGALIHPFFFGLITGYTDKKLWKRSSMIYVDVYYGVFVGLFVQMVSHNQMSTFMMSLFPAFLFFLITFLLDHVILKRHK